MTKNPERDLAIYNEFNTEMVQYRTITEIIGEIADKYGVTDRRVRQIVKAVGKGKRFWKGGEQL